MERHSKAIVSTLFTVVLILGGYLWTSSQSRMDRLETQANIRMQAIEDRYLILAQQVVDNTEDIAHVRGTLEAQ